MDAHNLSNSPGEPNAVVEGVRSDTVHISVTAEAFCWSELNAPGRAGKRTIPGVLFDCGSRTKFPFVQKRITGLRFLVLLAHHYDPLSMFGLIPLELVCHIISFITVPDCADQSAHLLVRSGSVQFQWRQ